jgi:hypothetical protein
LFSGRSLLGDAVVAAGNKKRCPYEHLLTFLFVCEDYTAMGSMETYDRSSRFFLNTTLPLIRA